jgi:AAA+ ATPase superfamily predicted ATPase
MTIVSLSNVKKRTNGMKMALLAGRRFIGRQRELERLNGLLKRKLASFVVIKGRRRIGKSRLIEQFAKQSSEKMIFISFSGLAPSKNITAQVQRDEFARQLGRVFQIPIPYSADWGDLFWHLGYHTKQGRFTILMDEISWMGMKSPAFLGQLKTAWDEHFSKNPQLILIICGSVSSWIEKNILSSSGFVGRIDLVLTLEELSLPECNEFWGKQGKTISAYEKFKVLSVIGGIPRYLENINSSIVADELIRQLCFMPDSLLVREFDEVFHDLFTRKSETYRNILRCLVDRPNAQLDDIFKALGIKKSGMILEYLDDLSQAGFVRRSHTWSLVDGHPSKLRRYSISDNYVRFYLKYIEPNKSRIRDGAFETRSLISFVGWEAIMGFQFENLVIKNRAVLHTALSIYPAEIINDGPYFQKQTQRKAGCQIDYLVQTKYNALHVCEIKFSKNPVGISVVDEVRKKVNALERSASYSIRPILIHVNGVEDEIHEHEFFSDIIPFSQFLIQQPQT